MERRKRVLVTGGGGFIGGWIVEALSLSGRATVRAGVRRLASGVRVSRVGAELCLCDVMRKDQIQESMHGVDAVVHCAVGDREVSTVGTRNVFAAVKEAGVTTVLYLSSVAVYGDPHGRVDESRGLSTAGTAYARTKVAAEAICDEYRSQGLGVIVLRPTVVYGPFSTTWTENVATRLVSGRWGTLGAGGEGRCNLLYIDDLIEAIWCALNCTEAAGETLNINGPEIVTWNDYWCRLNDALGLVALPRANRFGLRIKASMLMPVRTVGRIAMSQHRDVVIAATKSSNALRHALKRLESEIRTTPTPAEMTLYRQDVIYDIAKAKRIMGYVPRTTVGEGIKLSAAWLKHHGIVP